MTNFLDREIPEDPITRVHEFARDLAYWVTESSVRPIFSERLCSSGEKYIPLPLEKEDDYFRVLDKWNSLVPFETLQAFGYVKKEMGEKFLLTKEAFNLLDKPKPPVSIFISYHQESSAPLALLVEARLKLVGAEPFLDRQAKKGRSGPKIFWEKIRNCKYFICIFSPKVLNESIAVKKEIEIANQHNKIIIPIWEPDFDKRSHIPNDLSYLGRLLAIKVENKNTSSYNHAIEDLINAIGYSSLKRIEN